jgi:hypothetical protein
MMRFAWNWPAWDRPAPGLSNSVETIVQSRTNLATGAWVTLTNLPYREGSNSFAVAMTKPAEFFRVGWRVRK